MLEKIEAVIFDLDGTLIDSMWVWRDIDIEYLGKRGIIFNDKLQSDLEGMTSLETAKFIKNNFNISESIEEMINEWHKMAKEHYTYNVDMKLGALDFLKHLKEEDIKIGISTSNSRNLVDIVMDSLKIKDYFDHITTGDDVANGKPSPDIFLKTAKEIEKDPSVCLAFEDIPMGIIAGKSAGMKVCAVEDEFSKHLRDKKKDMADYFINDFTEIMEI